VDCNPFGARELSVAGPVTAYCLQEFAFFAELLEPVVAGVSDPHITLRVEGDRFRLTELAAAVPCGPDRFQEFAFGTELLKTTVVLVGNPEVSFGVKRNVRRMAELAVAGSGRPKRAVVERDVVVGVLPALNSVVAGVGDPEVSFVVGGNSHRIAKTELPCSG